MKDVQRSNKRTQPRRSLGCESLEDRRLLAVVTSAADSGAGSLRDAIASEPDGGTVTFAPSLAGQTITLTGPQINVNKSLRIDGIDAPGVVIDANGNGRAFNLTGGGAALVDITLANLDIRNGVSSNGGAIASRENTLLENVKISGSSAGDEGGAVWQRGGSLTMVGSEVFNNTATFGGGISIESASNNPANAMIRDSIIRNNTATDEGGGFFMTEGEATIDNSQLLDNVAYDDGGGFAAPGGAAKTLTITNGSLISGNVATEDATADANAFPYGGGGVFLGQGTLNVEDSTISGNSVEGNDNGANYSIGRGGGLNIWSYGGGTLNANITGSTVIEGNSANSEGGGISIRTVEGSTMNLNILDGANLSSNTAPGAPVLNVWGPDVTTVDSLNVTIDGANFQGDPNVMMTGNVIEATQGAKLTIQRSTISGFNSEGAIVEVGGTNLQNGYAISGLEISQSTISNNTNSITSGYGGTVLVIDADATITNSTVSGNSVPNTLGGGISTYLGMLYIGNYETKIVNSTLTGNSASVGGGLYSTDYAVVRLENSIVSGNVSQSSGIGGDIYAYSLANIFASHSLIEDAYGGDGGYLVDGADGNIVGVTANLGSLADNGGPTMTHLPMAGSPAINAGDPASMLGLDQRGYARNAGVIDIGAVEVDGTPPVDGVDTDFNDDGVSDCTDLNMLTMDLATAGGDTAFDLTGDGIVDSADRDQWLADAGAINNASGGAYLLGDINLDGFVDVSDLNIWNTFKFTGIGDGDGGGLWCSGDINADGFVDVSDLNLWNTFKFQSSDAVARESASQPVQPVGRDGAATDPFDKASRYHQIYQTEYGFDYSNSAADRDAQVDQSFDHNVQLIPLIPQLTSAKLVESSLVTPTSYGDGELEAVGANQVNVEIDSTAGSRSVNVASFRQQFAEMAEESTNAEKESSVRDSVFANFNELSESL